MGVRLVVLGKREEGEGLRLLRGGGGMDGCEGFGYVAGWNAMIMR